MNKNKVRLFFYAFLIICPILVCLYLQANMKISFFIVLISVIELGIVLTKLGLSGIEKIEFKNDKMKKIVSKCLVIFTILFLIALLIVLIPFYK